MGACTESAGSASGFEPTDIVTAERGGDTTRDRVISRLAALTDQDLEQAVSAAAALDGGLRALVDLRRHALIAADAKDDAAVEAVLRRQLTDRFAPDTLSLHTIGPDAPEDLLVRLTGYEAVHRIRDRADLLRRLHPIDRRCFALCHPALGDDPVVFVEVALARGVAPSVQAVLDADPPGSEPVDADTATFYSINNCQPGLRGIPFGTELLRRVMDDLSDTTSITTFATLSPIPGFARWLGDEPAEGDDALLAACARYLLTAKRGDHPHDPVARFHLGSGARLERLNAGGDTSPRGLRRYRGVTANYLYDRARMTQNQAAYQQGEIVAADAVTSLLDAA